MTGLELNRASFHNYGHSQLAKCEFVKRQSTMVRAMAMVTVTVTTAAIPCSNHHYHGDASL